MKINEKINSEENYFVFNLADSITEHSPELEKVRELGRRHTSLLTLAKDTTYKLLLKSGAILGVKEAHNLVANNGKNVVARQLAGDTTYSMEIDYGALGNGAGVLTSSSTQLDNELIRKQASSQAFDGAICYTDWFIASGDIANQTFTQFGSFQAATATPNSGRAFSLLSGLTWIKSGSIFISAKYTVN